MTDPRLREAMGGHDNELIDGRYRLLHRVGSGGRYCAVPMIEPVSVMSDAPARAIPKSVTLARPSPSMITL